MEISPKLGTGSEISRGEGEEEIGLGYLGLVWGHGAVLQSKEFRGNILGAKVRVQFWGHVAFHMLIGQEVGMSVGR